MSVFGNTIYPEQMKRLEQIAAELIEVARKTTNPRMTVELLVDMVRSDSVVDASFDLYDRVSEDV